MTMDTGTVISAAQASQNFLEAVRIAEEKGRALILQDGKPRYMLIDLEKSPVWDMREEEKIDIVAARILERFQSAFEELAK